MNQSYIIILAMLLYSASAMAQGPEDNKAELIDTHLHYNSDQAEAFSSKDIISLLDQNQVIAAIITSSPPDLALRLYQYAPERIIPFLGIYQTLDDKQSWHQDNSLPARIRQALNNDTWRGIGELHLFAEHRHSRVFQDIVLLAVKHHLPLLMHADPAIIDTLYEYAPEARVIWAHAGAYPYPPLLRDYLDRYPNLFIDLSMRNERIAPNGRLDPEWELLFMEYPDRFMIGVDTFSANRWRRYGEKIDETRLWLDQLSPEIANPIGRKNAQRLLMPSSL